MSSIAWKTAFTKQVFIISGIIFVLDQFTKWLVIQYIDMGRHIEVIPGVFDLVHTKNRGAAFGMFHDASPTFRLIFFGLVTIACLTLLFYWLATTPLSDKYHRFCLSLILGGAFGNLLDRTLFGQVTDFADFYYEDYHWPAFNIADSGITVGVTLIFLKLMILTFKTKKKKKQAR